MRYSMILVYILFAMTFSTVLSAIFSSRIPEDRQGDAFIGFFIGLLVLAEAIDKWLWPALAAGYKVFWPVIVSLIVFAAVLAASVELSIRTPRHVRQPIMIEHDSRFDPEAVGFDLLLWVALVSLGIIAMRRIGI